MVQENESNLEGVDISVDGESIGLTDSKGEVSSTFELTRTLDYEASKDNYVLVKGSRIVDDNNGNDIIINIVMGAVINTIKIDTMSFHFNTLGDLC